jgi:hypothetical protein
MTKSRYIGGYPLGDDRNWVEVEPGVRSKAPGSTAAVMPDIEGFYAPGGNAYNGGEFIEGRAHLREYERRTGTRQIGDQIATAPARES